MLLLSGTLQANTNIAAAQARTHTCEHTRTHRHVPKDTHKPTNVIQHLPHIPHSPALALSTSAIHSFLILHQFPNSSSPPYISCPNPLSHHYFSKPSMFAATHPGMEPLSFTLTLMNHSLPLKSPITSNRTVPSPLIFTKLSTHCGTELLVITFLSLTRLSGEY